MTGNNAQKRPHPAFRVLSWGVPLAALAVIAALIIPGKNAQPGGEVSPPARAGIPYVGFAEIDSIIAGASVAFEKGDYKESASLLTRARFFIRSGINEGRFDGLPRNLELVLGLSEFYRGYSGKGILIITGAAETDPENETYSWYLGQLHLSEGNRIEAKKYLERTAAMGGVYSESSKMILEEM